MALVEAGGNDGLIFLSIYDGCIKRNVDQNVEGAQKRVTKNGKTIYEIFYKSISGVLTKLEKTHHDEYGYFWAITLTDKESEEQYILSIPFSSRQSDGFLRRLPNIDLQLPLVINCGKYNEKPYLTISQQGSKIAYYWTRENPGRMPPMEKVILKGQEIWDDTKKMQYLESYVNKYTIPQLTTLNPIENVNEFPEPLAANSTNNVSSPTPEPEDDLPF